MKASRESFGEAIVELGESHPEIVVLDADLSKSTKSEGFQKSFPERFFQMGIAEANMIGTAAGLAMSGKTAFACSFGCFLSGRYDQIRMSVSYNRANVKLVGTHAGVAIGEDGHSQMGLEDVALLRSLPNMEIFQPADQFETKAMIRYLVENPGPAYIRLTRQKLPDLFKEDHEFKAGTWDWLKKGKDLAFIGTGALVHSCLEASKNLGGQASVINASSLKPVDESCLESLLKDHKIIVTAEDHYTTGGLGSAVAEYMAEKPSNTKLLRIGVEDFGESGSPDELYRHFRLDAQGVEEQVRSIL